jgi:O-antigen/teichoic acid export membrane protein
MSSGKRIARDSAFTLAVRIGTFVAVFLKNIIIARVLGPEGKGYYALIITTFDLLNNYGRLGIDDAIVYRLGRKPEELKKVGDNILTLALIIGGIIAGGVILLQPVLAQSLLRGVPVLPLTLMIATVPLGLVRNFGGNILKAQRRITAFNMLNVVRTVVQLVATVLFVMVVDGGLIGGVVAAMLATILPTIIILILISAQVRIRPGWDWATIKEMVSFGVKTHISGILFTTVGRIDIFIVSAFLNPAAVGLYSVASTLTSRTLDFPDLAYVVIYPNLAAAKTDEKRDELTQRATRNLVALTTLACVAAAAFGQIAITLLYGEAYRGSYPPFVILLVGTIAASGHRILAANFKSRGMPALTIIPVALALILDLIGDLTLIPTLGIEGAALASAFGLGSMFVLSIIIFTRISKLPWWETVFIQRADIQSYRRMIVRLKDRYLPRPAADTSES